jgi:hypothetical protein
MIIIMMILIHEWWRRWELMKMCYTEWLYLRSTLSKREKVQMQSALYFLRQFENKTLVTGLLDLWKTKAQSFKLWTACPLTQIFNPYSCIGYTDPFVLMCELYGITLWDEVDWITSCLPPHNKVYSTLRTSTYKIHMEIPGRCKIVTLLI